MSEELHEKILVRPKGQNTCVYHHGKQLELVCTTCHNLACLLCVPSVHNGHGFVALKDVVLKQRGRIQRCIENTEKSDLMEFQTSLSSAEDILQEDARHFDNLERDVKTQGDRLKDDIDLLTANTVLLYHKLKEENVSMVHNYIKELEQTHKIGRTFLQDCKILIQAGSDIEIFDSEIDAMFHKTVPVMPVLKTSTFSPNRTPHDLLEKAFGTKTIGPPAQNESTRASPRSTSNIKELPPADADIPYKLLPTTKVLGEFTSPCNISAICPVGEDTAWISTGYNTLTLLNNKGEVDQRIECSVNISDICVSPVTNDLWVCSDKDGSVLECRPSRTPVLRFQTDGAIGCMCLTKDRQILIGMSNQIIKYTTAGKVIVTTPKSSQNGLGLVSIFRSVRPLVRTPRRITQCSTSENVAVVDRDCRGDGGEDKPHVLVMDKNLQELFRYWGHIPSSYRETTQTEAGSFDPWDVQYDIMGNIIVADRNNGCLHLLSANGEYLNRIYTNEDCMQAVGVDESGVLWTSFGFGGTQVKLLQYSTK